MEAESETAYAQSREIYASRIDFRKKLEGSSFDSTTLTIVTTWLQDLNRGNLLNFNALAFNATLGLLVPYSNDMHERGLPNVALLSEQTVTLLYAGNPGILEPNDANWPYLIGIKISLPGHETQIYTYRENTVTGTAGLYLEPVDETPTRTYTLTNLR